MTRKKDNKITLEDLLMWTSLFSFGGGVLIMWAIAGHNMELWERLFLSILAIMMAVLNYVEYQMYLKDNRKIKPGDKIPGS